MIRYNVLQILNEVLHSTTSLELFDDLFDSLFESKFFVLNRFHFNDISYFYLKKKYFLIRKVHFSSFSLSRILQRQRLRCVYIIHKDSVRRKDKSFVSWTASFYDKNRTWKEWHYIFYKLFNAILTSEWLEALQEF